MAVVELVDGERALEYANETGLSIEVAVQDNHLSLLGQKSFQNQLKGEIISINTYQFPLDSISDTVNVEFKALHFGIGIYFNSELKVFAFKGSETNLPFFELRDYPHLELLIVLGANFIDGIESLTQLKGVILHNQILTDLSPLSSLSELTFLEIKTPKISELTPIENFTQLKSLHLHNCDSISSFSPINAISSLEILHIDGLHFSNLANLDNLKQLKELKILNGGEITDLRPIIHFSNLEILDLSTCESISNINPLGNLNKLKVLDIGSEKSLVKSLSDLRALAKMPTLSKLYLKNCENITDLNPLRKLFDLDSLTLLNCKNLRDLESLSNLIRLKSIELSGGERIKDLIPIGNLINLENLTLENFKIIQSLGPLKNLNNLKSLKLIGFQAISDILPLENLSKLKILHLGNFLCLSDLSSLQGLRNLEELNLTNLSSISKIFSLSSLFKLTSIHLSDLFNLSEISTLSTLKNLSEITIRQCNLINNFSFLSNLESLNKLQISSDHIMSLSSIRNLQNLCSLHIYCNQLVNIGQLISLPNLEYLVLESKKIVDISFIIYFEKITSLKLECSKLKNLNPIANLFNLISLTIYSEELEDLSPLSNLHDLQNLNLQGCKNLKDLNILSKLTKLKNINLDYCKSIQSLTPLENLINLTKLNLNWCNKITNLKFLYKLKKLKYLYIRGFEGTSLHPLSQLFELETIDLGSSKQITSVKPLLSCKKLSFINCAGCSNIHDFELLENLPNIKDIEFSENQSIAPICYVVMSSAYLRLDTVTATLYFYYSLSNLHLASNLEKYSLCLLQLFELPKFPKDHYLPIIGNRLRNIGKQPDTEIPKNVWSAYTKILIGCNQPTFESCLSSTLENLDPQLELEPLLYPVLTELAELPKFHPELVSWVRELVESTLTPVEAVPELARKIAPAAAVFYAGIGDQAMVRYWIEKATQADENPAWRDRIFLALVGFHTKKSEITTARAYLEKIRNDSTRDKAIAQIAEQLAAIAPIEATDLLQQIGQEALRFETAEKISQSPQVLQDTRSVFQLLLTLGQKPEALARVIEDWLPQLTDPEIANILGQLLLPAADTNMALPTRAFFLLSSAPQVCDAIGSADLALLREEYLPKDPETRMELFQKFTDTLVSNQLLDKRKEGYLLKSLEKME